LVTVIARATLKSINGVSALPALLIVSAILIELVVVSTVVSNALSNARFSERLSAEAFSAARSGAQDAAIRVIRYKNCPTTPGCPATSTLNVGNRTADVTITDSGGNIITIDSVGTALGRKKRIQAILEVDSNTGEVSVQSFHEIPL
jgi:hypothetical protein